MGELTGELVRGKKPFEVSNATCSMVIEKQKVESQVETSNEMRHTNQ
jgi:hypothetical protein